MDELKRLEREINTELSNIDKKYDSLLKDVKQKEKLLAQKNKEIEQAIKKIQTEFSKRSQGNSDEAAEYLRSAEKVLRSVDNKPHEKFLPGRFEIFSNSMKDGRQLFRSGLFEAAAAVAVSAKSGLQRLSYNIDDKVEEWEKTFNIFSEKLETLREKINNEISNWGKEINNRVRTEIIIEINFWSRGNFDEVIQTVKKHREIIKAFSQIGKDEYIKRTDTPTLEELKNFIEEIDEANKKFSELVNVYKERYSSSCERSDMGENIIDFMTSEINLEWLENLTGYDTPSNETEDYIQYAKLHKNINQDFREWLRIVFENSSGDNIYVYIVPVEEHGHVKNHVILHIDYHGAENEIYSRGIYQHVQEAAGLTNEIESGTEDSKITRDIEQTKTKIQKER